VIMVKSMTNGIIPKFVIHGKSDNVGVAMRI